MKISNPYTIKSSTIKVNNTLDIDCSGVKVDNNVDVGYYDDTKIKQRLSLLESRVDAIENEDNDFDWRLSRIEGNYVTKDEFNSLEGRVTTLETIPVGITNDQMDEILD